MHGLHADFPWKSPWESPARSESFLNAFFQSTVKFPETRSEEDASHVSDNQIP